MRDWKAGPWRALRQAGVCAASCVVLAGCAGPRTDHGLDIDTSRSAQAHSSRVQYIVLHYTAAPSARSLDLLTGHKVSSHYVITDEANAKIYQLVDESRSAWHAGQSDWYGRSGINANAIGIEIVNPGRISGPGGTATWPPYSASQQARTIALVADIAKRHDIAPENIVGHSDIAPQRKIDPGPQFFWRAMAQAGLGRWFDETLAMQQTQAFELQGVPDVAWFQRQLAARGYTVPQHGTLDRATQNVIAAFQMHYRPARYDGTPDAETAAILTAMPLNTGVAQPRPAQDAQ